ncbi:hypothetical protein QR680_013980 [Steinernema hermaphroditum]|uniref:Peptidase S1 domain-containing protein n=1 Tax=Steinernema hermaphroditum TaxID=289476 RepID=A0AA39M352_9BILA|nr:hypothetical protein QR680_013980 [Steinernema hermaphroditum]
MTVFPLLVLLVTSAVAHPLQGLDGHEEVLQLVSSLNYTEFVFGGDPVKLGQIPDQVLVLFKDSTGKSNSCGASLISPTHVLTAAHCSVEMISGTTVIVGVVDIRNRGNEAQVVRVSKISTHPEFSNDKNYVNDIAVLELSSPVHLNFFVKVAQIYKDDSKFLEDKTALVSGFGTYKYVGKDSIHSPQLLATDVTLFPFEYCNQTRKGNLKQEQQICAGAKNKGVGPGDSGGPLHVFRSPQLVQIGIVSYGSPQKWVMAHLQDQLPAIFTRVSHYCDYINEVTGGIVECQ